MALDETKSQYKLLSTKEITIKRSNLMKTPEWVERLFRVIDNKDADGFVSFLTDDAVFTFGNQEPVKGKAAIREAVKGFFESIRALDHDIIETWVHPESVICRGTATYTRHDSSLLSVPFVNVFKMDAELIKEYLIYVDASQLYS